jgi:YD repeat-containing protein
VATSTSRLWWVFLVLVCVGLSSQAHFSYGKQLPKSAPPSDGKYSALSRLDPAGTSPTGRPLVSCRGNSGGPPEPVNVGIREEIPEKYRKRYEEWKKDFLSTQIGQQQWEAYAGNSHFLLTITMARENRNGAATGKYKWDDSGKLVAATIALGDSLDHGYPNPIYYPVQNSLSPFESSFVIDGEILAATKLAHEFGHVNRMSVTNSDAYRLQIQLIPVYNSILLRNGYDTNDPKLTALARQMGGTPIELWEDREYWGEANAMLFLRDRISKESFRCALFRRIERSVQRYAKNYEERFVQIAQATSPSQPCSW